MAKCTKCGAAFKIEKPFTERDLCDVCLEEYNDKALNDFLENSGIF